MIIFLTGPTGVGKTDASWALLSALNDIVFLDCDWFASRSGFNWQAADDVASVYRALQSQMAFHIGEGRNDFIVPLTLEMAKAFTPVAFANIASPVFAFRLGATAATIERRIIERGRPQRAEERTNAIRQHAAFDRLFPDDTLFRRIDTSDLQPEGVAEKIVRMIRK